MKTYVSLTSINGRQETLINSLSSLLNQTQVPDKIYLFLSEEPYMLDRGFKDKNLESEELEKIIESNPLISLNWVENIGPYRKLLPALKNHWEEDCCIITVDDDCNYSNNIVEDYTSDLIKYDCVIGYRGFTPFLENNDLLTFNYFKRNREENRSLYNFVTGLGGVAYHPKFFRGTGDLIFNQSMYKKTCEKNDDVWFYILRIKNNIDCVMTGNQWCIETLHNTEGLYTNFNNDREKDLNTKSVVETYKVVSELSK